MLLSVGGTPQTSLTSLRPTVSMLRKSVEGAPPPSAAMSPVSRLLLKHSIPRKTAHKSQIKSRVAISPPVEFCMATWRCFVKIKREGGITWRRSVKMNHKDVCITQVFFYIVDAHKRGCSCHVCSRCWSSLPRARFDVCCLVSYWQDQLKMDGYIALLHLNVSMHVFLCFFKSCVRSRYPLFFLNPPILLWLSWVLFVKIQNEISLRCEPFFVQ